MEDDLIALLGGSPEMDRAAEAAPSNGSGIVTASQKRPETDTTNGRGALDIPFPVTFFTDTSASTARREILNLRDMAERLQSTRATGKDALPLWKLATFGDARTVKNSLRHDDNLEQITGIEGDYDAGKVTPVEAVARLRAAGIAALVHTTPSHRPGVPRWRVLCPLAQPVAKEARSALVERLNDALGGVLASESFTPSQPFYFGTIEGRGAPETHLVDGRCIDAVAPTPRPAAPAPVTDDLAALLGDDDDSDLWADYAEAKRERDWEPDRIRSALRAITDASDRDTWLQIGMALHHASGGADAGYDLWCRWSRRCPEKYDDRDQRRTWKSFGRRGGGVTIASLYQVAKGYGFDPAAPIPGSDDDLNALLGESKPAEDWQAQLDRDDKGIQAAIANVRIILGNDPRVKGCLSFDLFQSCRVLRRKPDLPGDFWRLGPLSDVQEDALKEWLARPKGKGGWGLRVSSENLQAGINLAAHSARFHPIREWLDAQRHDGKTRADRLFVEYLGAPDTPYHREAARLWLLGAVARVHEPGHKFDFVPILEGKQGVRKSTFAKVLGVDWGGDPVIAKWGDGPKVMEQISPFWIVELGELAGMRKAEVAELKAALSRTTDHGRMAYDRNAQTRPRQCVFIGTTNESHYLRDQTGNRRYWPIVVRFPSIDTDKLQRERGQIWAEALAQYRAMRAVQPHGDLPLFLSPEAEAEARGLQASRKQDTPAEMLAARIVEWLLTPLGAVNEADDLDPAAPQRLREFFCAQSVWHEMLGKPEGITMSHAEAIMYGQACNMAAAELGWAEVRERTQAYGQVRGYRRNDE